MSVVKYPFRLSLVLLALLIAVIYSCKKEKTAEQVVAFKVASYYPNSGRGGTLVTIVGEGFDTDQTKNTVTFAGIAAEVLSAESNELVVLAPATGSSGPIQLNSGTHSAEVGTYTYQDLSVQRIFPTNGPAGSHIRISGEGFGSLDRPAEVRINHVAAVVVSASDTLLVAEVPPDAGSGPIEVTVDGMQAQGQEFTFQAIRAIKPLTGGQGTRVTISGEGFDELAAGNTVDFNGKTATVLEASGERLLVVAPDEVATGPLSVSIHGQKTTGPAFTVVPPPGIAVVSPLSGPAGSLMTIRGTQFSRILDENTVLINGHEVALASASDKELTLILPGGTGSGRVTVLVNDQQAEGPVFRDQTLGITSVSPDNGLAGTSVTITGTGFSSTAAENTVSFNGVTAPVLAATENSLTVTAPDALSTGQLKVAVAGMEALAPQEFRRAGVQTLAGGPGVGALNISRFGGGIAVDDHGNVFVLELESGRVMKVTARGEVSLFAGSPQGTSGYRDGTGADALFSMGSSGGIVIDKEQNLYVSDASNRVVRKITPGGVVTTFADALPTIAKIAIRENGDLYVAGGSYSNMWRLAPNFRAELTGVSTGNPYDKHAVDAGGNIFNTVDQYSPYLSMFPAAGGSVRMWVGRDAGFQDGVGLEAKFASVNSIVPDGAGNLLVIDNRNKAIRKVNIASKEVTTLLKSNDVANDYADGTLSGSKFYKMDDITIDKDGVIYILDGGASPTTGNHAIRKVFLR